MKPGVTNLPFRSNTSVLSPINSVQSPTIRMYLPFIAISALYISLVITFTTFASFNTLSAYFLPSSRASTMSTLSVTSFKSFTVKFIKTPLLYFFRYLFVIIHVFL